MGADIPFHEISLSCILCSALRLLYFYLQVFSVVLGTIFSLVILKGSRGCQNLTSKLHLVRPVKAGGISASRLSIRIKTVRNRKKARVEVASFFAISTVTTFDRPLAEVLQKHLQ